MISNATGEGATYLTEEEELTYEWYREIIFCDRRTGQVFKPYLQPFTLVAAVIVSHHPHRPPGPGTTFTSSGSGTPTGNAPISRQTFSLSA